MEEEKNSQRGCLDPNAAVWRGNHTLPTCAPGFKVLGVPISHPDFVEEFLTRKTREHELLFERIPAMKTSKARGWSFSSACNFFG